MTFKVKVVVKKTHQEYHSICSWEAYCYYKTGFFWKKVGLIAEARGNYTYQEYSGNFREDYLEKLHDLAYVKAIIHYRSSLLGNNEKVRHYDMQEVIDFCIRTS